MGYVVKYTGPDGERFKGVAWWSYRTIPPKLVDTAYDKCQEAWAKAKAPEPLQDRQP